SGQCQPCVQGTVIRYRRGVGFETTGRKKFLNRHGRGVSSIIVGRASVHQLTLRLQNAAHCVGSLLNRARRWHTSSVPSSPHLIPARFSRCPTTVLHALSTDPLPMHHPCATYRG